jgi:hypothetical protein
MNDLSQLKPKLVRLKLSGVLETLEQRIAQAMEEKWEYSQFLLNLLTDEVIRRDNRQLTLRVGRSGLNRRRPSPASTSPSTAYPQAHHQGAGYLFIH